MKITQVEVKPRQEDCFEIDNSTSIRYVLCLNGLLQGAAGLAMTRDLAEAQLKSRTPKGRLIKRVMELSPELLPDRQGPIVVLLVL